MLENKGQHISDVNDSTVNQAQRDVNVYLGMQPADVIAIVNTLVASKLEQYSAQAKLTAEQRTKEFSDKLVSEITQKVLDKINRFEEPSIQYITRQATLGYIKSGEKRLGDDLVDLLIERVRSEEHTTTQNIIDQAVNLLPSLSKNVLALLSLIAFRNVTYSGPRIKYEELLRSVNPLLEDCNGIGSLEVEYLKQVGCVSGVPSITFHSNYEEELVKSENLFFSHPLVGDDYQQLLNILELKECNRKFTYLGNANDFPTLFAYFPFDPIHHSCQSGRCKWPELLQINIDERLKAKLDKASKLFKPFSSEEVRAYLYNLDSNWGQALNALNRQDVKTLVPTTIGYYIACRQLTKFTGEEISLNTFYK